MKRFCDFTKEELKSVNPNDYEDFSMDYDEIPGFTESIENQLKKIRNGEIIPAPLPDDFYSYMREYWILTHPEIKKRTQLS